MSTEGLRIPFAAGVSQVDVVEIDVLARKARAAFEVDRHLRSRSALDLREQNVLDLNIRRQLEREKEKSLSDVALIIEK